MCALASGLSSQEVLESWRRPCTATQHVVVGLAVLQRVAQEVKNGWSILNVAVCDG